METILKRLDMFAYMYGPEKTPCSECQLNYRTRVELAQSNTENYFDGLCLDCMDRSNTKTGNADKDYWEHHKLKVGKWDRGCRVKHQQPTWYFSFMGRREDMDAFRKEQKARRHKALDGFSFMD